jgi:hypothetical protein
MCEWGTSKTVHCPAGFSGKNPNRQQVPVDACIADIVRALNEGGVLTIACCCGHGKGPGSVLLSDGRTITISSSSDHERERRNALAAYEDGYHQGRWDERNAEAEAIRTSAVPLDW